MTHEDPAAALVDALGRTSFLLTAVLTRLGADNELSLTQLRLLGVLRDRRARVTELADRLGLDKSTMSGLVARAERRGLVERDRNPHDGRVVEISLTAEGERFARRVEQQAREVLTPALDRLPPARQAQLAELLDELLGDPAPSS
ncbi:MarR family winged helix-turn-helix transcriptional regulator [Cellulomonas composti]|uniref:HTH marR-type domain-containing protein n=1 Tax=Cellulomonas composti TaxID=266130 RepID=A0A511J7T0_9CELL|nr:MarR family transcriptional regulator [Cellulomonas composti]GEL94057.1 hypothetical protein CCO02nite_07150 [Cellulomonas composti]